MAQSPAPFGIDLNDVSVRLAGKPVLTDLTLTLTEARIGIVGRNGSGKTTLLRLIAGLVAPDHGAIRVHGYDPMGDRRTMLGQIGILFQNPDRMILFPTVIEELAFGLRQMGRTDAEARDQARAALADEGRAHWADAPTHTLSQGQRHHLCLMAVLLMEPRTLLLDEPFAGMDLPTIQRMQRKLAGLPQQVITISHDPDAVAGSDRVIWLEAGRVVSDGPAPGTLAAFRAEMSRIGGMDADTDLSR
jgi:biotin transport system ATP-binding protein